MAYGNPQNPVAATVITVAYAVANILDPIRALRANTGGADPPAANRIAISTAPGGPTTWQQVPTDAILDGSITDVKLFKQKMNLVNPSTPSAVGGASQGSAIFDVSASTDHPTPGAEYQIIQARHGNWGVDYRFQLAAALGSADELYCRWIVNGELRPWRKIPFSTGSVMASFNADMVDGYHAGHGAGQIPVSDDAINTFLNAGKLGGFPSGNAANQVPISNGTLAVSLNADMVDGYHAGNAGGQIPISNNILSAGLNANYLGGSTKAEIIAEAIAGAPTTDPIPSGLVAIWTTATPPTGWTVDSRFAGFVVAGAGAPYGTTLLATGGASSVSHSHAMDHQHAGGTTGNNNASGQSAGTGTSRADDPHTHTFTTPALGATPRSEAVNLGILPPYKVAHYVVKS